MDKDQQAEIAKAVAAEAKASDERRSKIAADTRKRVAEETKEQIARQDTQPTPTQEENDRAKLGVSSLEQLDDKEPDGSPEETTRNLASGTAAADYSTRSAAPKK